MHSVAKNLYFLHGKNEDNKIRKESKVTHSLYNYLREEWLKTVMEHSVKKEKEK